jgi:2-C-methyl-D-erythritol 4-phosphate cytidylyltransferase
MRIGGEPILAVTARRFSSHPAVRLVVVAAPRAHLARARRAVGLLGRRVGIEVVEGGAERQESVWRALQAIPADVELILVHDAVRPFVTRALIDAVLAAALEAGAAICARPIAETVKRVASGHVEHTVDRQGLWAVQTPQGFRAGLLREAHERARREGLLGTDDAMLVERLGQPVRVVLGPADNVKITTPEDLRRARAEPVRSRRAPRAARAKRARRSPPTLR